MRKRECQTWIIDELVALYGARESNNIAIILWEDLFGLDAIDTTYALSQLEIDKLNKAIVELRNFKPVQYVTGLAHFYGYRFYVNEDTLIPRPETEELVYKILQDYPENKKMSVLDIGTGSGCIPISLAGERNSWDVSGLDISKSALEVSSRNSQLNEVSVDFRISDILNEKEWKKENKVDIIISNPPYIPVEEQSLMHKNVLDYEPHIALFVYDKEPLLFYYKILEFGMEKLNDNGRIYFECNEYNAQSLKEYVIKNEAYKFINLMEDMQGKDRILIVQKKGSLLPS